MSKMSQLKSPNTSSGFQQLNFKKSPRIQPLNLRHQVVNLDLKTPYVVRAAARLLHTKYNERTLQFVRTMNGGWESWFQIELVATLIKDIIFLKRGRENGHEVTRGKQIWQSNERNKSEDADKCDIWMAIEQGNQNTVDIIEVTVAYEITDSEGCVTVKPVRKRMIDDMRKVLNPLSKHVTHQTQGWIQRRICLAVTSYPEELMVDWCECPNVDNIRYYTIVPSRGNLPQMTSEPLKPTRPNGLFLVWWIPSAKDLNTSETSKL